jgi:hypothetical protein
MHILPTDQEDPENAVDLRRALVDTGSDISLVPEATLDELGIRFVRTKHNARTLSVGVELIGCLPILWRRAEEPRKNYNTIFYVIPRSNPVDFEFLLGKDWLRDSQALSRAVVNPKDVVNLLIWSR